MSVFDKRTAFKPFEYPEVLKFREALKQSRWDVEEFNLDKDAFEFTHRLNKQEQEVIKRTVLAISQIEVSVKLFWSKLYDHLPKPEISLVSSIFYDSESVHAESYSKILDVLGFNDEYAQVLENPVIGGRVEYLSKYLKNSGENSKEVYTLNLALFSMFIEAVSLFSQFPIIKSFAKHKNLLKEIDSIVDSTMLEEVIHSQFGIYLINLIKKEFPDWFNEDFYRKIERACKKAFEAEVKILDWIFEEGEIETISKKSLVEFIKIRFNESLEAIGAEKIFEVTYPEDLSWILEDIYSYTRNDFFDTQGRNYSKYSKSITVNDLF